MTSIEIPKITYSNNKIQECQLTIDSKSFTISYQNNEYKVSQGEGSVEKKNESNNTNQSKEQSSTNTLSKGSDSSSNTNTPSENKSTSDLAQQLKAQLK